MSASKHVREVRRRLRKTMKDLKGKLNECKRAERELKKKMWRNIAGFTKSEFRQWLDAFATNAVRKDKFTHAVDEAKPYVANLKRWVQEWPKPSELTERHELRNLVGTKTHVVFGKAGETWQEARHREKFHMRLLMTEEANMWNVWMRFKDT